MMAAGMKNGEIRPGPPSSNLECSRSMMSNPPMPEATYAPTRSALDDAISRPAMRKAKSAAATASWMKRPIFFNSFLEIQFSGSKLRTSAAMRQSKPAGSKRTQRRSSCSRRAPRSVDGAAVHSVQSGASSAPFPLGPEKSRSACPGASGSRSRWRRVRPVNRSRRWWSRTPATTPTAPTAPA